MWPQCIVRFRDRRHIGSRASPTARTTATGSCRRRRTTVHGQAQLRPLRRTQGSENLAGRFLPANHSRMDRLDAVEK